MTKNPEYTIERQRAGLYTADHADLHIEVSRETRSGYLDWCIFITRGEDTLLHTYAQKLSEALGTAQDFVNGATANGNTTRYAEKWMECNRALMAALANPSQVAFDRAASYAILTIGSAYASTNTGVEWEMAQDLYRLVRDVAKESGYTITGTVTGS